MNAERRRRRLIGTIDAVVGIGLVAATIAGIVVLDGGSLPMAESFATTTTAVVSAGSSIPVLNRTAPLVSVVAATTPAVRRAPLTGEVVDEATATMLATRRTIVVKIDDAPAVRTHPGLDQADLVYEVSVEGGLTRYLAIFQSRSPERVGPVRSVRTTDFSLVGDLSVPVLAFSGGNQRTVADAMRLPVIAFPPDVADEGVYQRDSGLKAPHNLFLSPRAVWDRVVGAATVTSPFGNPRSDGPLEGGIPVPGMRLQFSNVTDSSFVWDGASRRWIRFQRGTSQLDGAGQRLGVDNVVVVFTSYGVSPYDRNSPEAVSVGGGAGVLLNDGAMHPITWTRSDPSAPFTLSSPAGDPIDLPAGRTWVAFVGGGSEQAVPLTAEQSATMLARP